MQPFSVHPFPTKHQSQKNRRGTSRYSWKPPADHHDPELAGCQQCQGAPVMFRLKTKIVADFKEFTDANWG